MEPIYKFLEGLDAVGIQGVGEESESGEGEFLAYFATRYTAPVVMDVGGNEGDYTAMILDACPKARVLAFEPHPETFSRLLARMDGANGVSCHNLAMGEKAGTSQLFDYQDSEGSGHASLHEGVFSSLYRAETSAHEVSVYTVDAFVAEHGIDHVDFLKIDVEGNELAVLKGAAKLLERNAIDVIQFEFNEMNIVTRTFFKDFWEYLQGYDFHRLSRHGCMPIRNYIPVYCEIYGHQNIICTRKGLGFWG